MTECGLEPSGSHAWDSAYHGLDEHRRETGRTDLPQPLQEEDVRAA